MNPTTYNYNGWINWWNTSALRPITCVMTIKTTRKCHIDQLKYVQSLSLNTATADTQNKLNLLAMCNGDLKWKFIFIPTYVSPLFIPNVNNTPVSGVSPSAGLIESMWSVRSIICVHWVLRSLDKIPNLLKCKLFLIDNNHLICGLVWLNATIISDFIHGELSAVISIPSCVGMVFP